MKHISLPLQHVRCHKCGEDDLWVECNDDRWDLHCDNCNYRQDLGHHPEHSPDYGRYIRKGGKYVRDPEADP